MRGKRMLKVMGVLVVIALLIPGLALATEQTIQGKIEKSAHGFVLNAADGETYMIEGQDASGMVGKTVKATGTVEEGKSGKMIKVQSMEEVKE